ncbi:SanA/YdcF family protein [Gordonia sp. 852002-10350_SCH5691597]|uniref:SanA/YdcF family protein n=1 Tax=Gordonia sp. 852002-10350_SCH5691597 TaxID=1834085 RepID=UPI0007E9763E|nr:ElyC/SanA/YdcF family protein [Gordonia sp. 852002-10350_SCH5691597]OBA72891.1 hypothetical protein A5777_10955 [Gordonia sp. 852002-10350_SCH5691597]
MLVLLVVGELVVTIAATWVFVASSGRIVDAQRIPNRSTLLVLGSLVSDGEPGSYVRGRLDTALELYRTGAVARVVVSGNGDADAGDEPAVMRDYLEAHGVPASVIVDDPAGYDTERSCRRLPEVIGEAASNAVVIVTQDFHVSRAIALCRARGIDALGVEAQCPCSCWTLARNHIRETFLARPRALLSVL